ncbi:hypothetical protein BaRGS_00009099 [Batillaria attramentaria]|uniref:Secreted protein n=1 Tax=Batillaria attramentaria TaxID=370345 RepID=A0ABD0LKX6_9CAEN
MLMITTIPKSLPGRRVLSPAVTSALFMVARGCQSRVFLLVRVIMEIGAEWVACWPPGLASRRAVAVLVQVIVCHESDRSVSWVLKQP